LGITPLTTCHRIGDLGQNCKSFEELTAEIKTKWGRLFLADGKAIFIKGKEHALSFYYGHPL
jgi:hypothetical protein